MWHERVCMLVDQGTGAGERRERERTSLEMEAIGAERYRHEPRSVMRIPLTAIGAEPEAP